MIKENRIIDNKAEEMLDIVDINDNVVGIESRESYKDKGYNPQGKYVRVVNCFIINSENKIWCPVRSANKRSFPNSMDFSCGGYVQSGETYIEAMVEEIKEENGIKVELNKLIQLDKLTPKDENMNVFMGLFKYVTDEPIVFSEKDFSSAQWLTINELIEKLENGFPAKNHLLPVLLKYRDKIT